MSVRENEPVGLDDKSRAVADSRWLAREVIHPPRVLNLNVDQTLRSYINNFSNEIELRSSRSDGRRADLWKFGENLWKVILEDVKGDDARSDSARYYQRPTEEAPLGFLVI